MILKVTLIGLLAGVIGTGTGGIISALFKKKVDLYIDFFMGISGGVMIAVVVFDLMKEAIESTGVINTVMFTFVGTIIAMLIKNNIKVSNNKKSGYLIFMSILLHNLPEGLAIGSSFMATKTLGITLAIVIGIHNIPEGLAMALSLLGSNMGIKKVIILTMIAGIPMGVGSFLGVYFAAIFSALVGMFLGIASGTMMYVVLEEILPKTRSIYCVIGFLAGTLIVNFI